MLQRRRGCRFAVLGGQNQATGIFQYLPLPWSRTSSPLFAFVWTLSIMAVLLKDKNRSR
jgi:hypothetical protein